MNFNSLELMLVWYGLSIMYGYSFARTAPFRRQAVNKFTIILMTSLIVLEWKLKDDPLSSGSVINLDIQHYLLCRGPVL